MMVLLIGLLVLLGLFFYSSVGLVFFIAAAVVLVLGLKNGQDRKALLTTLALTALLIGLGIFFHELRFADIFFP